MISLNDAAKYYKGLPGQKAAFDYLLSLLTPAELEKFAKLYRDNPPPVNPKVVELPIKILSQRDYKHNDGLDRTHDSFQTCNVHSVSAVINYAKGKNTTPKQLDDYIKTI
jgi:hypothetical protein